MWAYINSRRLFCGPFSCVSASSTVPMLLNILPQQTGLSYSITRGLVFNAIIVWIRRWRNGNNPFIIHVIKFLSSYLGVIGNLNLWCLSQGFNCILLIFFKRCVQLVMICLITRAYPFPIRERNDNTLIYVITVFRHNEQPKAFSLLNLFLSHEIVLILLTLVIPFARS